ncbi:MAG TPA: class I SAM-dependent methyltransferase [Ktedonobacterales bacterium]|jgi:demethylmenaquinone methyltransferase/2-methoxy-6-polyprenyl-1,4-benzoquinol methylase|nr:class I SAM-dependent methyltransferase [Ktedonobacterales bacterium]
MTTPLDELLGQQIDYYRERASEYDEWFLRQGRYDRGAERNVQWFAEAGEVTRALDAFAPRGSVLEFACGTGLWTQHLVRYATSVTALDSSPEMLALNRARVDDPKVRYMRADLFGWQPDRPYNIVFFSFWLSHVPPERCEAFWDLVKRSLAPRGRVFFIDSLYAESSTARDHQLPGRQETVLTRLLNDGREYSVIKVFYQPEQLLQRLHDLGWTANCHATANYFLYGSAEPND